MIKAYWIPGVCAGLGITPGTDVRKFFFAWWSYEGGNGGPKGNVYKSAKFNWLNTMWAAPGATDFNDIHVKNYPTWDIGVKATVDTLKQPKYSTLVEVLRAGTPLLPTHEEKVSKGLQIWVSGKPDGNPNYAKRVLKLAGEWKL